MLKPTRIILKFIIIFGITLVLGEIVLRAVFDEFDPEHKLVFQINDRGYQLGPSGYSGRHSKNTGDFDVTVRSNLDGFRDTKALADSSIKDWFLVGDSFSFGFGVEEQSRYSNLLESQLGFPVFNISAPNNLDGYGFLVEYARRNGANIGRLMVGVCMENDLAIYSPPVQFEQLPTTRNAPVGNGLPSVKYYLSSNSAVYMALTKLIHHSPWLKNIAVAAGLVIENLEGIPVTNYSRELVESSADRLQGIASMEGINEMLIILIPSRGLWVEKLKVQQRKIHNAFVDSLNRRNLEFIDLTTQFENAGNPLRYHFKDDGHWNESGHALAASVIAKQLNER